MVTAVGYLEFISKFGRGRFLQLVPLRKVWGMKAKWFTGRNSGWRVAGRCPACFGPNSWPDVKSATQLRRLLQSLAVGRGCSCKCKLRYSNYPEREGSDAMLKKPQTTSQSKPIEERLALDQGKDAPFGKYPTLLEWLVTEQWEDGSERKTSTILVFGEEGRVKVRLADRETDKVLWVTAESVRKALASLEADLVGGTGEWRDQPQYTPGKRK